MFTLAEQHDVDTMLRQGWGLTEATQAIIDGRPGRPAQPRRSGLSAAEIEIRRLQAATGQPRPGEDLVQRLAREHRERQAAAAAGAPATPAPTPPAPGPAPSDATGTRAQRHALNLWSREQALATAAKMREQRGGWGR